MVKLSDIELPVIFKNQLLFKAGSWNHLSFSNQMVDESVKNTKWSALNKRLYFKHENQYDISQWKGKVESISANKGEVRGDVEIWDANEAVQILHGQKPIALSADIEYNDSGVMYFTGFALEADPGVRDSQMFLSNAVKNELDGMFHASFNNQLALENISNQLEKEATQTNTIDTQSTERRLEIKHDTKMDIDEKSESKVPQDKVLQDKVTTLEAKVIELTKQVESTAKAEVKTVEVKEVPKATIVESSLPNPSQPNIIPMDEKSIANMVDKIVEQIKPITVPTPVTISEMGAPHDSEDATIDRLAKSLAN